MLYGSPKYRKSTRNILLNLLGEAARTPENPLLGLRPAAGFLLVLYTCVYLQSRAAGSSPFVRLPALCQSILQVEWAEGSRLLLQEPGLNRPVMINW